MYAEDFIIPLGAVMVLLMAIIYCAIDELIAVRKEFKEIEATSICTLCGNMGHTQKGCAIQHHYNVNMRYGKLGTPAAPLYNQHRQTRAGSASEAITGTVVGFLVTLLAQQVIFPAYGITQTTFLTDIQIIGWFTLLSVIRGYAIRRFYNSVLYSKIVGWFVLRKFMKERKLAMRVKEPAECKCCDTD